MLSPREPNRGSQQPSHVRKSSFSNTISWLSRSASTSHAQHSKPKISGPLALNAYDNVPTGVLGTGATVVRTPEEALALSALQLASIPIQEQDPEYSQRREQEHRNEHRRHQLYANNDELETDSDRGGDLPSPPHSPAILPARPFYVPKSKSASNLHFGRTPPPESTPLPPVPPLLHIRDPSMAPPTPPPSDRIPSIPPLPSPVAVPAKFAPVLVSPLPRGHTDHSKMIVCLETSTVTYRSRLQTLQSRPSRLANYLTSILSSVRDSGEDGSESRSPFQSIMNTHINNPSPSLEPSPTLHIFLDRPSTPYAHILSYLRMPPGGPPVLPRAVQIRPSYSSSAPSSAPSDRDRIDALLELRDEASYLDLDDLHKLCVDEITWLRGSGASIVSTSTSNSSRPSLTPRPRTASVTSSSSQPSSSQNASMEPLREVPESPTRPAWPPALQVHTAPAIVPAPLVVKKTRSGPGLGQGHAPASPGAPYVPRMHPASISPSRSRESLSGGRAFPGSTSPGPTMGMSMGMLQEEETSTRKLPKVPHGFPSSSPAGQTAIVPSTGSARLKSSPITPSSAPGWI